MKLVRFLHEGVYHYGKVMADGILALHHEGKDFMAESFRESGLLFEPDKITLLAPCTPSKVVCMGLNYSRHAEEVNMAIPEEPIVFIKPCTSVIGPGANIIFPPQSKRIDYEAELVVVVGRKAKAVPRERALDYVLGYTCGNDVTARDKQPATGQWTYAKAFDTFCPLGPLINTDITDPENLHLKGYLNDVLMQDSSTSDHIFSVAEIIAYVSACMTLLPGDLIMTGTPSGIGPMKLGDSYTVHIEEIGSLSNRLSKVES